VEELEERKKNWKEEKKIFFSDSRAILGKTLGFQEIEPFSFSLAPIGLTSPPFLHSSFLGVMPPFSL